MNNQSTENIISFRKNKMIKYFKRRKQNKNYKKLKQWFHNIDASDWKRETNKYKTNK